MLIAKKQKSVPLRKKEKTDNHFDETMKRKLHSERISVQCFVFYLACNDVIFTFLTFSLILFLDILF